MTRAFAAILAMSMAVVWAGGCQEEQASSAGSTSSPQDVKMARLIAAENRELKAQMKKQDDEIKNLNTQLQAEAKKRDDEIKDLKTQSQTEAKMRGQLSEQLAQCAQTRDEKLQEEADKQCKDSVSALTDWVSELTAENDRLQTELESIKGKE